MGKVTYGRGYVYTIQYHIVWCTKYRHKIIQGKVETTLKEIIGQIAEDNNFRIEKMESDLDHIHLLRGGHLWNPSYFIATVSENTEEQIREYIKSQKIK